MRGGDVHELAVTQSLVAAVADHVGTSRVARVTVAVGRLSGVVADSLHFYFDLCADGTPLEGAKLEILDLPAHARCRSCAAEVELNDMIALCPCGSADLEILDGQDLTIKQVEVVV
jgi:hydrogenase nickel incorporation protein HypA/HybF